ncbi:MAG: rhomboid family intrarane serine protease [Verrucomicrobiales bacterium]|nr:rhomboid family intrarane serine protease [Verrucomicrobiales bacterium]
MVFYTKTPHQQKQSQGKRFEMFVIVPVAVDYQARRYPVVTFTIIGLNFALYILSLVYLFSDRPDDPLITHLGLIPEDKVWYTWITSMFVHAGFFHILGNMIYLFLFGACLEDMMGRLWYTLFYLGSGLLANLTQVLLTTSAGADIPIVGASGAISACIGGFLIIMAKTKINFRWFFFFFFRLFNGEFWLAAWIVISFWFLVDFASLLLSLRFSHGGGGTAFGAHVGGTLAGCLTLWLIRKKLPDFDSDVDDSAAYSPAQAGREAAIIYLSTAGNQVGPYSLSMVHEMISLGSVAPEAYFWKHGMAEWRPIGEL